MIAHLRWVLIPPATPFRLAADGGSAQHQQSACADSRVAQHRRALPPTVWRQRLQARPGASLLLRDKYLFFGPLFAPPPLPLFRPLYFGQHPLAAPSAGPPPSLRRRGEAGPGLRPPREGALGLMTAETQPLEPGIAATINLRIHNTFLFKSLSFSLSKILILKTAT